MSVCTLGILLMVYSPVIRATTYHWKVIPERIPVNATVTIEFWLEDYQTMPYGGIGNLTIDLQPSHYYGSAINNDTFIQVFRFDGEQCETYPLTWHTWRGSENTSVSTVLCDYTAGKFAFTIGKLMDDIHFFAEASNQEPNAGYSDMIYLYRVYIGIDTPYPDPYTGTVSANVGDKVGVECSLYLLISFEDRQLMLSDHDHAYFSLKHVNNQSPKSIPPNTTWQRRWSGVVSADQPSNYRWEVTATFIVRFGDDGWYQCQAAFKPNTTGSFMSEPKYMKLVYAPVLNINEEHTDHIGADIGEKITFSLPILANPIATAAWIKDSRRLRNDRKFIISSKRADGHNFQLSFVVGKDDFGTYKCVVSSDLDQQTFYFFLNRKPAQQPNPNTTIIALLIVIMIIIIIVVIVFSVIIAVLFRRVALVNTTGQQITNVTYQANEGFHQDENTYENPEDL